MKIAIPEFQGRVSPVFDSSQRLLVFKLHDDREPECQEENWSSLAPVARVARLREIGVDVLLCGGISGWLSEQVAAQNIQLFPWIAGDIQQVLAAYLGGRLPDPQFAMPGCCGRRWRGGRDRCADAFFSTNGNGFVHAGEGIDSTGKRRGRSMGLGSAVQSGKGRGKTANQTRGRKRTYDRQEN
ncbi:MAG: hypothetical protein ABIH23_23030 [bacterium]